MFGLFLILILMIWAIFYHPSIKETGDLPTKITNKLDQLWEIAQESIRENKYLRAEKAGSIFFPPYFSPGSIGVSSTAFGTRGRRLPASLSEKLRFLFYGQRFRQNPGRAKTDFAAGQPLTEPSVMPLTKYFWKNG